ncbi:hypothetical protein LguiB_003285 [Lonicera macranthoides]
MSCRVIAILRDNIVYGPQSEKNQHKRFADGEIYVQLQKSIKWCNVYLVLPPANENLMELLVMIDACRKASVENITAMIPYFGYTRANKKMRFSMKTSIASQKKLSAYVVDFSRVNESYIGRCGRS